MSKVQLQGNVSGTGIFTIASPNSNTDRTLTLPDNTGTILTNASNLAGLTGVGKVLQVVFSTSTTAYSTTSTTYQATNHAVTITPSSTSSRILVLHQGMVNALSSSTWCWATLYRSGTNLYAGGAADAAGGNYTNNSPDSHSAITMVNLDSPSTTSAVTYTAYFKSGNGNTVRYNADGWKLWIVAMEIAA